jgi:two-component system, chemotaxis family, chemotaxis protein CheY
MSYNFSKLRVLVVDDSASMRAIVRTILAGIGVEHIVEAGDGAAAFQKLLTNAIDMAVVDWIMPGHDGVSFIKRVRTGADSPNQYLPIVMVTARTERARILEARDAGATEFLAKPITPSGLVSRIVEIVERPRPFVRTKTYFGPCRRRRKLDDWSGVERRGDSEAPVGAVLTRPPGERVRLKPGAVVPPRI